MDNLIKLRSPSLFFKSLTKSLDLMVFKGDPAVVMAPSLESAQRVLERYVDTKPALSTVEDAIMGPVYREEAISKIAGELHEILGDVDASELRARIISAIQEAENGEEAEV